MSFVKRNYIDGETVITAENLNDIQDAIIQIVPDDVKQALLQIASKVAYIDEHGQDYYDALEAALYPEASLVSISAVYTQSGTVYDTDSLDSLKADLVVTAHFDDSSTSVVTAYTLSGTLDVGTSTITVAYSGKTTTFDVTVTKYWDYEWDYTDGLPENNGFVKTVNNTPTIVLESNGLHITCDQAGEYVRYSPAESLTVTEAVLEVTFIPINTADAANNGVRLTLANGTTGVNVKNNIFNSVYMTGESTPTNIATLSANTEYTERIEYSSGGTQKVYLNGNLIHSDTNVCTIYMTRSGVLVQDRYTEAYLKSMKWKIIQ